EDFPGAVQVTYQDGYFIFIEPNSERFFISESDGTSYDGEDSPDVFPDFLVGAVSNHRDLWLFGQNTIEVWFNSGNATFPFERIEGAFIEVGCLSAFSIAKAMNSVFWLG